MMTLLPQPIEDYLVRHSMPEPEVLQRLREETVATLPNPQMLAGPLQAAFLSLMIQISGASRVLEIGTFSGYSALAMALVLPPAGRLITCDVDPVATAVARRYFDRTPAGSKIELRLGNALQTIEKLTQNGDEFDFVFIDADKTNYVPYWDSTVPLVRTGGLILADNTLWSGRVVDPQQASDHAIVAFNRRVTEDPRVDQVLLPVRDGVMVARKR